MTKPPFDITNTMLNQMVDISHLIGQLQHEYERNLHLRKNNRLRSIQSSLAIENNSLSLEQVTDIINGKRILGSPKEIQEVKNAYDAYELIEKFDPFSIDNFLKAHQVLTYGLVNQSGQFRQSNVGIFDNGGNLIHMGARPPFIEKLITDLFTWANADDTPAIIKSAVVHYEIEVIHPFEDGNGRMGRLWQTVILSQWQPIFAWLPVETMVYAHQNAYYQTLRQADKANNSTVFIEFMLDIIQKTLKEYIQE
ncbi:Fic family protein [Moraxella bovis]|uniref:Fic family protein n=1 Tax=Moraxella bovis TaxID=476 RepID=UPI000DC77062|nr:Fic family protein [Moraxella bovis]AWY21111.1 Fic family protein [Moraxella bovis]